MRTSSELLTEGRDYVIPKEPLVKLGVMFADTNCPFTGASGIHAKFPESAQIRDVAAVENDKEVIICCGSSLGKRLSQFLKVNGVDFNVF